MATVYLALGSNVGDSRQYIEEAIKLLGNSISDIARAPIYESKAVGYTDQDNFLNTAMRGDTSLKPQELLKFVKDTELKVGRIKRFRWGPREIDIDIILYDNKIVNEADLTIPHARFRERDFVLKPLQDLGPKIIDPVSKLTIKQLLAKLPKQAQSIGGERIVLQVAMKAIIVYKGKVLILREAKAHDTNTHSGRYQLPGGRVNPGENFAQALDREVKEETKLKVKQLDPVLVGEWRPVIKGVPHQIVGTFIACEANTNQVALSSEHDDYKWIKPTEYAKYKILSPDNEAVVRYAELHPA